jgi:hypothetical protein
MIGRLGGREAAITAEIVADYGLDRTAAGPYTVHRWLRS